MNHQEEKIYLDLLCWESFIKILLVSRAPKSIRYCQVSKLFKPFIGFVQALTHLRLQPVSDFVYSEARLGPQSAYEVAHLKVKQLLELAGESWLKIPYLKKVLSKNNFNAVKVQQFLKENAFYYLHRPMEIIVLAEIESQGKPYSIMLRKTYFAKLIDKANLNIRLSFYPLVFSHYFPVLRRPNYHYDGRVLCFTSQTKLLAAAFGWWLKDLKVILTSWLRYHSQDHLGGTSTSNIFVEFLQSRLRQDEINDIFWLPDSEIAASSVYNLEIRGFDRESKQVLTALGTKHVRLYPPLRVNNASENVVYFKQSLKYISQTLLGWLTIAFNMFNAAETGWVKKQLALYKMRVAYWRNLYRQLNIKIVWAMYDEDCDKLVKAQALELLGGLYIGSHWSNYPFVTGFNQKCYDVLLVWGDHFRLNIFNAYPYLGVFEIGYPSDHYFKGQIDKAREIRNKYPGKFIVSYMDSMMTNDIHYSLKMQLQLHTMLVELLEKNPQLIVFLKPKRKKYFQQVLRQLPQVQQMINQGRLDVFLGETQHTKAVPAMVGLASDLVFGLGISTAAAECCFAGTVAFHADLTGFLSNEFANQGLNKVVFRDLSKLTTAIQAQIDGQGISAEECKKYHQMLDPFQDGKAYLRTGFVLKQLQEAFQAGLSREEAVKKARAAYNDYVAQNFNITKKEAVPI